MMVNHHNIQPSGCGTIQTELLGGILKHVSYSASDIVWGLVLGIRIKNANLATIIFKSFGKPSKVQVQPVETSLGVWLATLHI